MLTHYNGSSDYYDAGATHPPVATDSRWAKWRRPLLIFLSQAPRDWSEIDAWLGQQNPRQPHPTNCIAWLDQAGLIRSFYDRETGMLRWVGCAWRGMTTGTERPSGWRRLK